MSGVAYIDKVHFQAVKEFVSKAQGLSISNKLGYLELASKSTERHFDRITTLVKIKVKGLNRPEHKNRNKKRFRTYRN